jgi:Ca-activated chloride channel family protein
MSFGQPQFLYALVLLPVMAAFMALAARQRRLAILKIGDASLLDRLTSGISRRGRRWRAGLLLAATALTVLALARPQWGSQVEVVERKGAQIMVALDVSESMLAEDVLPNRLTRAKLEVVELMSRLSGDEIGLVLFSGTSFIQHPLTGDYSTARVFLESARPGVISRPGTALGDAMLTALQGFDTLRPSQRVVLLLTDGEGHEGNPISAAQRLADDGVIVYVIGFGSPEGEPIPEYDGRGQRIGYKLDRQGEIVFSKLDEATLQEIATVTDGSYYRAGAGSAAVEDLVAQMQNIQREELESDFGTRPIERFQLFLLASLAALVLAELMPRRVSSTSPRDRMGAAID